MASPDWAPPQLSGDMDLQEKPLNPRAAAGGWVLNEHQGLLEVHCVRKKCFCKKGVQQAGCRQKSLEDISWKWQEGISNWEGGGKRKGKAYKEMEVFTGIADQLQRRIFFFCSFVYSNRKPRIRELGTALRSPLKSLVIISVSTGKTD